MASCKVKSPSAPNSSERLSFFTSAEAPTLLPWPFQKKKKKNVFEENANQAAASVLISSSNKRLLSTWQQGTSANDQCKANGTSSRWMWVGVAFGLFTAFSTHFSRKWLSESLLKSLDWALPPQSQKRFGPSS